MIKSMNFAGHITLKSYPQTPSERTLTIYVPDKILPEWCLNLILLSKGRLETVHLMAGLEPDVYFNKVIGHKKRNGSVSWSANRIDIMVCKNTLDQLIDWISEYYITGTSSVNHVDMEFASQVSSSISLNLVVGIEHGTPPIRM